MFGGRYKNVKLKRTIRTEMYVFDGEFDKGVTGKGQVDVFSLGGTREVGFRKYNRRKKSETQRQCL